MIASPSFTVDHWHVMANMAESLDAYNSENSRIRMQPASAKMVKTLQHTFWAYKQRIESSSTDIQQDSALTQLVELSNRVK